MYCSIHVSQTHFKQWIFCEGICFGDQATGHQSKGTKYRVMMANSPQGPQLNNKSETCRNKKHGSLPCLLKGLKHSWQSWHICQFDLNFLEVFEKTCFCFTSIHFVQTFCMCTEYWNHSRVTRECEHVFLGWLSILFYIYLILQKFLVPSQDVINDNFKQVASCIALQG